MSGRRKGGAGQSGQLCLGEGAGGRELQRKARRPAGARARKNSERKKPPENSGGVGEYGTRTHGLLIANQSLYQLS